MAGGSGCGQGWPSGGSGKSASSGCAHIGRGGTALLRKKQPCGAHGPKLSTPLAFSNTRRDVALRLLPRWQMVSQNVTVLMLMWMT